MIPQYNAFDIQKPHITCLEFNTNTPDEIQDVNAILLYNDIRRIRKCGAIIVHVKWKKLHNGNIRTIILPYKTNKPHRDFDIQMNHEDPSISNCHGYHIDSGSLPKNPGEAIEPTRLCYARMRERK